jgi:hypothetical protein
MRLPIGSFSIVSKVVLLVATLGQAKVAHAQADIELRLEREVTIGSALGSVEYVFGKLLDVAAGPDGVIYALDAMNQTIAAYSATGEFLRSFGGERGGPAEFGRATAIRVASHGVRVFDLFRKRIVVFGPEGVYRSAKPIAAPAQMASVEDLGNDMYVGQTVGIVTYGTLSDSVPVAVVVFEDESVADTLLAGQDGVGIWYEKGKERFGNWLPTDFGRSVAFAVDRERNRVLTVDGNRGIVQVYRIESDGRVRPKRRLDTGLVGVPVTEADLQDALGEKLDQRRRDFPHLSQPKAPRAKGPREWSGIGAVIVEDSGHVWLEEWGRRADSAAPVVWRRYDPTLSRYSSVEVPGDLQVKEIRNGRFYGIVQEEAGYDQVVVFRVVRRRLRENE